MKRVQYYSPDRVDGDLCVDVAGDLGGVHVGDMLEVSGEAVVLHDEGVEDVGEVDVAVLIAGVDPAVLQGEYVRAQFVIKTDNRDALLALHIRNNFSTFLV